MAGGFLAGLGKVLDAGTAYIQHTNFAQRALGSSPREVPALLAQYTQGLSEASFSGFKVTLTMLIGNEADGTRRAGLKHLLDGADAARRGEAVAAPRAALQAAPPVSDFDQDLKLFSHWYDDLNEEQRRKALVEHICSLSPAGYKSFMAHMGTMVDNCDQTIRQHEASEANAWGGFIEDRMAYQMARLRTGQRDPAFMRQLQAYQQVKAFAEWVRDAGEALWAERLKLEAAARTPSAPAAAVARSDNAAIKEAVRQFTRTGQYPGGADKMQADVATLVASGDSDEVMAMLEAAGAKESGNKVLNIGDHYRPGNGLYELRWPVGFALPIPFDQLDRPTQFSVLFGEWSRREMEGSYALLHGTAADARQIFEECLARAQQIDVPELIARSHEGLARVAGKTNQRSEERKQLKLAVAARARE